MASFQHHRPSCSNTEDLCLIGFLLSTQLYSGALLLQRVLLLRLYAMQVMWAKQNNKFVVSPAW